ncbi:MAG TPA: adenylate/guanylate cyclase domain-containing protein [Stellaceae bacterium]|nr:adenylate/guanylate cyclase domain-containing protein [Stellaceae bacterium]
MVKTTGDGMLIEFASVVDAVRCAVVVQQGMEDRNANIPEDHRIRFRIGINLGDIIIDEGDIFGDGVNVAARLEALAEPGEICVSASVREQIGEKLPIGFADRGEHTVKNITRPVHVYRIDKHAEVRTAAENDPATGLLSLPDRPSIAVLPFQNMSGDAEQDYFVDGMVEDIITGLSRIKWLFVIARNSSFAYKGQSPDIRQVGRELGVRYVLEGSVRKAAARVRITGQLVEAETGRHIWAERYDRAMDDVFALQDEMTMNVVAAIEPSLRQAEVERVKRKRPENLDAYDLVLRATPLVVASMPETALRALPLLERALTLEPDYALAHGQAAWCYENLFVRAGRRDEHRQGAIRHTHAAIAYGRDDATALTLGGFNLGMIEHDRAAASEAFEAAIVLSPSSAFAYILGSIQLGFAGDVERAIEWGERGLRLSPLDPWSFVACHGMFLGHFQAGRFEQATNAARKSVQHNPGFSISHMFLAAALGKLGQIDEAKAVASRVLALQPGFSIADWCAATDPVPAIAVPLSDALRAAGLPE